MVFGGGLDDNEEVMSEINMIFLVDVMLVLLIIFIIIVLVLIYLVKVDLFQVDNIFNEIKLEMVSIVVIDDCKIYWNEDVVNFEELE